MKLLFSLLLLLTSHVSFSETLNERILKTIDTMPKRGGYVLSSQSPKKLRDAFTWNLEELTINESIAIPSYCTTATYIVFFKVLKSYWEESGYPSKDVQELFKANVEADGVRMWGRWNSNGPGTAKLFHDGDLGTNFDDLSKAIPGDFLKIFWNTEIGKNEKGHSVIFLKATRDSLTFWSSNTETQGYGVRTIPMSMAKRLLFSRLERPENAIKLLDEPAKDEFLASMLTRVSSWAEVKEVTGF